MRDPVFMLVHMPKSGEPDVGVTGDDYVVFSQNGATYTGVHRIASPEEWYKLCTEGTEACKGFSYETTYVPAICQLLSQAQIVMLGNHEAGMVLRSQLFVTRCAFWDMIIGSDVVDDVFGASPGPHVAMAFKSILSMVQAPSGGEYKGETKH